MGVSFKTKIYTDCNNMEEIQQGPNAHSWKHAKFL